jgi:hypothetical protein
LSCLRTADAPAESRSLSIGGIDEPRRRFGGDSDTGSWAISNRFSGGDVTGEAVMSIADHEIDEPEVCNEHGVEFTCRYCRLDNIDLYADAKIQDAKEGK